MTSPRRKLLIILGAGSSIDCGMPSVAAIDGRMKKWCREWSQSDPFMGAGVGSGVFNDLWNFISEYYQQHSRQHIGIQVNFEKVLGEMVALASWVTPSPFGNALRHAVRDGRPTERFTWIPELPAGKSFFYQQITQSQYTYLLKRLAESMRDYSRRLQAEAPQFAQYRELLSGLRKEFEVGLYNLNYDNLAIMAWPDAFTGFRAGEFDPRAVSLRREWSFIYHLHGSVHYSFVEPFVVGLLAWKNDLNDEFGTHSRCRKRGVSSSKLCQQH